MSAIPLNETASICGKSFHLFSKTGRFSEHGGEWDSSYRITRDDIAEDGHFTITPGVNLKNDIGIELGDRISIVSFKDNLSFFLIYNHRNSRYKFYPEAIDDLYWSLKGSWLQNIVINYRLKKVAKSFPESKKFSEILKKVSSI